MLDTDARRYLVKRFALSFGLLAFGAAMAWAVSLALLQDAAIAAGALPRPGSPVMSGGSLESNPLWQAATTLQKLANTSGAIGAILLISYGAADYYWGTLEVGDTEDAETAEAST